MKVKGSLVFYEELFNSSCSMDWRAVCEEAAKFVDTLTKTCPGYVQEMRGVADGAGVDFLDIVALNVRTEITFGLFTVSKPSPPIDGCTSLAYKLPGGDSVLAQNWDWQKAQSDNLFICHVSQPASDKPSFVMVTEGGIIGKIGFNSEGVGVCLNAIRARGIDRERLPVHLALRTILESNSRGMAIDQLKKAGIAGSAHFLIADSTGSTGLECTNVSVQEIHMDHEFKIVHANNLILGHPGVEEPPWLEDSPHRTARMAELTNGKLRSEPNFEEVFAMFKDEQGYPAAINRCQVHGCETQTLFNIIMNLTREKAQVTFGRPTESSEQVQLTIQK